MDIIHLLPDSVANQIAAGEVVQRPASIVKELMENALDAGASDIRLVIKDAGRTLIQVIDNGKGMSETDARMSFERHATSKIRSAGDLFALRSMGFRGEALASIAAVAQVELRTRRDEDELGTFIQIEASKIEAQEAISCPKGSMFSVKNLFFNIPARRKFLKKNETELRHIITEFNRIAIIYPQVSFSLLNNKDELYNLPESTLRQRIINIFGKSLNSQLLELNTETSLVKISGFVGKPETARKQMHNQYFFVNGRYMNHSYFRRAVLQAFDRMLAPDTAPSYFIAFDIDPATIDVNIHPTKTEIKFENEQAIWSILLASVREALGKFNIVPGIDFDAEGAADMPVIEANTTIRAPQVSFDPDYNPFAKTSSSSTSSNRADGYKKQSFDWEKLYTGFQSDNETTGVSENRSTEMPEYKNDEGSEPLFAETEQNASEYFNFKGKYLLTSVKSGLMIIDRRRAHIRVLFEQYLTSIRLQKGVSQQSLFPECIELSAEDSLIMDEICDDLSFVGFDIEHIGKNCYQINGVPSGFEQLNSVAILEEMLLHSRQYAGSGRDIIHERIALSLAKAAALPYGKSLSAAEITALIEALFACPNHNYDPEGNVIISILSEEEIAARF
ncbi:MAG: DNA mismatch repair endonuclease MutL [Prevotellaceae bacterium]|jgi:DNA mismatch repair protein MutL|nr:DNA mismatch repair endonuclease MutL [Prevotellaceae bacterium]